jgi:4-hydroxy-4-methyl-2-oxoglutarate aldolase
VDVTSPADVLELGAATLGESGALAMAPRVHAAWAGAAVAGPAFTARCPGGDNLAIHVAVTRAPAGAVIVVDASDRPALGYWGEVLTTAAEARRLGGLVIDGGVRDVAALASHRFPVFSTTVALPGATKAGPGECGGTARVGDVEVTTGDWIVGDVDGVVVIPAARLEAVVRAGRERAAQERRMFDELRAGQTTVDLLGLDPSALDG